jgi:23S rRNA pseudouridine1911/1915/1917 synthase
MTKKEIQDAVVFNDEFLLIVNKPNGISSQDDLTGDDSIHQILKKHFGIELFMVHRIDRPVSGLIIYAKNKHTASNIGNKFLNNEISKTYLAAVKTAPKEKSGTLEHQLVHESRIRKSIVVNKKSKISKTAILDYEIIGKTDNYTFLSITPKTGRFHQIRAQLAEIGSPIKGDVKYGARRKNADRSIHLHSFTISLRYPNASTEMKFTAQTPNDSLWSALGEINPLVLQNNFETWNKNT